MQYKSVAVVAAFASGAFAAPNWGASGAAGASCANNDCLAAVTGKAALGDGSIRASHCSSYLATTVTPIVTETVTITGSGNDNWKRATVAFCPNEVPNYASACDDSAYTSACSCFGYTEVKTTTVAPTTTTKTIWVKPTGGSGSGSGYGCSTATVTATVVSGSTCAAGTTKTETKTIGSGTTCQAGTTSTVTQTDTKTVASGSTCPAGTTKTETKTIGSGTTCQAGTTSTVTQTDTKTVGSGSATTVTVTVGSGTVTATTVTVTKAASTCSAASTTSSSPASSCSVSDALATTLVNNFVTLLEYTSYNGTQGAKGRGYKYDVSAATLDTDFVDISDSINFMAGFPVSSRLPLE